MTRPDDVWVVRSSPPSYTQCNATPHKHTHERRGRLSSNNARGEQRRDAGGPMATVRRRANGYGQSSRSVSAARHDAPAGDAAKERRRMACLSFCLRRSRQASKVSFLRRSLLFFIPGEAPPTSLISGRLGLAARVSNSGHAVSTPVAALHPASSRGGMHPRPIHRRRCSPLMGDMYAGMHCTQLC